MWACSPAATDAPCAVQGARRFDYLTERLNGKSYLMGDQFMVVDAYVFTVLSIVRGPEPRPLRERARSMGLERGTR
ncbi:MAG: glutathione binding-like protein [Gammaproteobacteria bacterium]